MKKILLMLLTVGLAFGLAACGGESADTGSKKSDASKNESTPIEKEDAPAQTEEANDNVEESEVGKLTIAYKNKELNENAESGPISLNVSALQIADLEVAEDYKEMFDNKDKVTVITMQMKVENSSDDTISIYPDQATITTDTGDQSEAEIFLSDSVGGDFIGKVNKEGNVIFVVKTPAADIGQVNLIIDGAHDENLEKVGDQIKLSFPTK